MIKDEKHERTLSTDLLLSYLSRIRNNRTQHAFSGPKPLKFIIMSATLSTQDILAPHLVSPLPPVLKVDGRQFKVVIHYNKITRTDYVGEAVRKISKIHERLPLGGILVFVSGVGEVREVVRQLNEAYNSNSYVADIKEDAVHEKGSLDDAEEDDMMELPEKDDYQSASDEESEEEQVEILLGASDDEKEPTNPSGKKELPRLLVLPLYSLLPTKEQKRNFDTLPPNTRLWVLATNVAETSLTIPGIKYVVDTGN
jgi:ATP-dependent RNA helicase DHX37/DHR1